MVDTATKLPIKTTSGGQLSNAAKTVWHPFEDLRREVDHLFEDFGRGGWLRPLRTNSREQIFRTQVWNTPAVDIAERDRSYEITAELPGMDAKNLEVTLRNGSIVLKGEKQEQKEEKSKDYYLQERQYGSFERTFALPESVNSDQIEATFSNGVLTIVLPKTSEAQKAEKTVKIKAA